MESDKKEDDSFDKIFGDFFTNLRPMTKEEIQKEKEEEQKRQEEAAKQQQQFLDYARNLPGAEKETKDNPIVQIKGELEERAVTREELINNMFSNFFTPKEDHKEQSNSKQYKK